MYIYIYICNILKKTGRRKRGAEGRSGGEAERRICGQLKSLLLAVVAVVVVVVVLLLLLLLLLSL